MDIYGIDSHLQRAKSILDQSDEHPLVYAALELRFCFEAIAYRHLALYNDKLPGELVRQWKADQIIKTLVDFDPTSDQTSDLAISISAPKLPEDASETERNGAFQGLDYLDLGTANRITWKVFRKHYNALGSYLHLDRDQNNVYPTREKLLSILTVLEEAASSKIIYAVTDVATAVCACKHLLVLGPAERAGRAFFCPNRRCNRIYATKPDKSESTIYAIDTILIHCPCGAQVPFHPERVLKPAECPDCRSTVQARIGAVAAIVIPTTD